MPNNVCVRFVYNPLSKTTKTSSHIALARDRVQVIPFFSDFRIRENLKKFPKDTRFGGFRYFENFEIFKIREFTKKKA